MQALREVIPEDKPMAGSKHSADGEGNKKRESGADAGDTDLAGAKQVIARQAEEIQRLRKRLEDESFAEKLREALSVASMAGAIATPVTHTRLLEMIVQTAARVILA